MSFVRQRIPGSAFVRLTAMQPVQAVLAKVKSGIVPVRDQHVD